MMACCAVIEGVYCCKGVAHALDIGFSVMLEKLGQIWGAGDCKGLLNFLGAGKVCKYGGALDGRGTF